MRSDGLRNRLGRRRELEDVGRKERNGDGVGEQAGRVHGVLRAVINNNQGTVAGKLVAVNFWHEQWEGKSLPQDPSRSRRSGEQS